MSLEKLADIIFPNIEKTPEYYLEKYPKRNLKEGAKVTRYAPSPTGFQHIGGIFAALINERIAHESDGVFFLRVEDTDQKREVKGAIKDTIETINNYGMNFNEGMTGEETEKGDYGPYKQSLRKEIYETFAKDLIKKGLAYPCFCTAEELNAVREKQMENKILPGYHGEYATCRNLSAEEAIEKIKKGESYIIRLKSPGDFDTRVEYDDLIKGHVSFPENNIDIVLIKSDGLPTYHFAHAIDDGLMRTTHVIRGEEWLSSLPIHLQLFDILGFETPKYAHIPTIMKQDGGSKRKLSKRKDAESAVSYYKEEGYPVVSVIEYLLNIINSTYEEWREENPEDDYHEFQVSLDKMSKSGALFDIVKLNDVSKNVICKIKATDVYDYYIKWAEEYDKEMHDLVVNNEEMMKEVFNIDKEGPKPRKDFAKWSDVREKVFYFFDSLFDKDENIEIPKNIDMDEAKRIIGIYKDRFSLDGNNDEWFNELKEIAVELGYATDRKKYKKNPEEYKGMVSDVAGAIRAAVTHRSNTPDLCTIMKILGKDKVIERFNKFIK
ncbi:MAG: glutamate--tRNA ligase [Clostridiales bacterium]|nr:glutamate--tRNA ligase [Clostridiales bacterium]